MFLKIENNFFFVFYDISVGNSNFIDIVYSHLFGNIFDIPPEDLQRMSPLVVITHSTRWH